MQGRKSKTVRWIRESAAPAGQPVPALDCYIAAIQDCAQYPVELDAETTAAHVQHLTALAALVAEAPAETLAESRSTLRGLLRNYRDKAAEFLSNLRQQMESTAKALQETVAALAHTDDNHSARVRESLAKVRDVAATPEAAPLRARLAAAADAIEADLAQLRREQQFTVVQLQTEIRVLHRRVESLVTAAATDQASRFFNRRGIQEYVQCLPPAGVAVVLLKTRGIAQARARYGGEVAAELASTLARRARNCLPRDSVMGRWSEQDFLAILPAGADPLTAGAETVSAHLSMPYACLVQGKVVRILLQVSAEWLAPADGPPGALANRLAPASVRGAKAGRRRSPEPWRPTCAPARRRARAPIPR
jgi:GGDEF domain-containing protein